MADSPIRVRQNESLTAKMGPALDCPSAPQDFTNPLIGGIASLAGDSPLSHGEMDANWRAVYPIGSIYINATNSSNPSEIIGFGAWESFGEGRILIGHNSTGDSPRGHFNGDSPAVSSSILSIDVVNSKLEVTFQDHNQHQFAVGQFVTLSGIAPHTVKAADAFGQIWGNAEGNLNKEFQIIQNGTSAGNTNGVVLRVEKETGPTPISGLALELSKYDTPAVARFGGTVFDSPFEKDSIVNEVDFPNNSAYSNEYGFGGKISHQVLQTEMAAHTHQWTGAGTVGRNQSKLRGNIHNNLAPNYSSVRFAYPNSGVSRGTDETGGSEVHNNIDNYITAYIWRRTS